MLCWGTCNPPLDVWAVADIGALVIVGLDAVMPPGPADPVVGSVLVIGIFGSVGLGTLGCATLVSGFGFVVWGC